MNEQSSYDVIVVGAGIAGLTATAYLCKYGYHVLLCEKENKTGGLVGSFNREGFLFDSGIRAFENSGIVFPMLKQLGIDIEFVRNNVSIGIEDKKVSLKTRKSLEDYEQFLCELFPQNKSDIRSIIAEIHTVMKYMDVLYGIDNPLFINISENREYVFKTLIPWLFKYRVNINKAMRLNESVNDYLLRFTDNQALIDMISQHFFKDTPTFFALSYFGLYLDYSYPIGGTGVLPEKLSDYIQDHNGTIITGAEISGIDVENSTIQTSVGSSFTYKMLVWAANTNTLYKIADTAGVDAESNRAIQLQKERIKKSHGSDSILTIYLGTSLNKDYFATKCGAHFFYTPSSAGLSSVSLESWEQLRTNGDAANKRSKIQIKTLVSSYLNMTTYEISCPVLRDESLAPAGKTGIIISTLIDFDLVKEVNGAGWYDEFKQFCTNSIIEILNKSLFSELQENVLFSVCSTPLTIKRITGNRDGAITGWAFNNKEMPSESRFKKIRKSVLTPIPNVYQAGQWTFSPSGLPISVLTGKLAADEVHKQLQKQRDKEKHAVQLYHLYGRPFI